MARSTRMLGPNMEVVEEICGWFTVQAAARRIGVNYKALDGYILRTGIHCKVIGQTRLVTLDSLKPYADMVRRRTMAAMERLETALEPGGPLIVQDDQIGGDD